MSKTDLTKIGLSPAENLIYNTLLKAGNCSANRIAKLSGFHRTNVYDILNQLISKGLVVQYKENKSSVYKISDPKNLFNIIKEKEDFLNNIFPEILAHSAKNGEDVDVEVFKGTEGMKAAFNDQIRVRKTIYAFGVKGQLREENPVYASQYVRKLKENKIKYYGLYTENPPDYCTEVRFVNKNAGSPVATHIYGDNICISIWAPTLVSIVIRSKQVAKSYKKHFDLMWKNATI